jgi:hypothetical protein
VPSAAGRYTVSWQCGCWPVSIDVLLVDQIKPCFVLIQQARPVRFEKLPEQLLLSVSGFVISVY